MKWYEDLLVWLAILLVLVATNVFSFALGKDSLIKHCATYAAYKISDTTAMLCVVKPLIQENAGNLQYLPEAKEKIKKEQM